MVRTSSFALLLMSTIGSTGVASTEDYEPAPVKLAYDKEVRGGVTLAASLAGKAYRLAEYGEVVRVGCDPVGEYLVGEFGYFVVRGEKVFVQNQPCWEWTSEYLASQHSNRLQLVGAGGGSNWFSPVVADVGSAAW